MITSQTSQLNLRIICINIYKSHPNSKHLVSHFVSAFGVSVDSLEMLGLKSWAFQYQMSCGRRIYLVFRVVILILDTD